MSRTQLWVAIGLGVFVLVAGVVFAVAYFGNLGADRAQEQVTTCMANEGIWVSAWDSCVYSKGAL